MHRYPTEAEHGSQQIQQKPIYLPINNPVLQSTPAHVMPTPTTTWSMEAMPWKITKTHQAGDVMEFRAHAPDNDTEMRRALLHQKRKSELNATETLPIKQFISEEKMTAHFNGLHISSEYTQHKTGDNITDEIDDELPSTSGKCYSNLTFNDYQMTAKELRNANRIVLCEELKKFSDAQKKITYLPEALLNRIATPCTALVLWQPSPILNIFTQKNANEEQLRRQHVFKPNETIDDYTIPDVDLPPEREDIDDFIDNNNTCNLDFNNVKPDSMDEDL